MSVVHLDQEIPTSTRAAVQVANETVSHFSMIVLISH